MAISDCGLAEREGTVPALVSHSSRKQTHTLTSVEKREVEVFPLLVSLTQRTVAELGGRGPVCRS